MLKIVKALPHYGLPAELPRRILTLLDRMEQKPVVQQQQATAAQRK
jgi:hypothetical protein